MKPLKDTGIRAIHFILSGALRLRRWGWLGTSRCRTPESPASRLRTPAADRGGGSKIGEPGIGA